MSSEFGFFRWYFVCVIISIYDEGVVKKELVVLFCVNLDFGTPQVCEKLRAVVWLFGSASFLSETIWWCNIGKKLHSE